MFNDFGSSDGIKLKWRRWFELFNGADFVIKVPQFKVISPQTGGCDTLLTRIYCRDLSSQSSQALAEDSSSATNIKYFVTW